MLKFIKINPTTYSVTNDTKLELGIVKKVKAWNKWVFEAKAEKVYSSDALREIANFCDGIDIIQT